MSRAIPGPGDFVTPGAPVEEDELKPVNEKVFAPGTPAPAAPEPLPFPARPGGAPEGAPRASALTGDPFQPIREVGVTEERTIVFVVPDNRPHVVVPLAGPGVYTLTIRKEVQS